MQTFHLRRWSRKVLLLLCAMGCGACTSTPTTLPPSHFPVGPTDVDVAQRRLELIDRYQRPRIERRYTHDKTDLDMATPRPSPPKDTLPPR